MYRSIQFFRKEPVFEKLAELCISQKFPLKKIRFLQQQKLKKVLIHAYENTKFYRDRFDSVHFNPHHFSNIEELEKIPYLTKSDISNHFNQIKVTHYQKPFSHEFTSGSTGNPMRFCVDRNFSSSFRAEMYREHHWAKLDIGDREVRFFGQPSDFKDSTKEKLKDFLMNRKRFSVFDLKDEALLKYWKKIHSYQPDYIYGYTSSIARFSEYILKNNLTISIKLKAIITTSEILHDEQRQLIEEVWNTKIYNEYGSSECGIIASECEQGSLHLNAENNFVEFQKKDRRAISDENSEIIITNLNNYVMPFIRYQIGDSGSYSDQLCKCGKELPLMNVLEGRSNSMVITPDEKVLSALIFYYIFKNILSNNFGAPQFRAYQKKRNHIHFQLTHEYKHSLSAESIILDRCRKNFGSEMNITFEYVPQIHPLASGKLVHFISEI